MKSIKRIVLINVLIILINLIFINVSFARKLSGISDLRSSNNVGNTVYVWTGAGTDDTNDDAEDLEMNDERDHIYCIQHNANSDDGLMRIDQYMEIKGTRAKAYWYNNGLKDRTAYSKYNIALAYVLGQEGYRKAYSMSDGSAKTRQRAIHHLFNHEWKSDPNLGTNLIWDKWFHNWSTYSYEALGLYNRSLTQAEKNESSHVVPYAEIKSSTIANSDENQVVTGPYYITYGGKIDWLCPIDQYGRWIEGSVKRNGVWTYDYNIKFYKDANCTNEYKMTEIPSGAAFYIKNTSGKEIKQIQLRNTYGVNSWLQTDMKTVESSSDVIGPICLNYSGVIDWISPINEYGNWIEGSVKRNGVWTYDKNISFYTDAACTNKIEMTNIESNKNFYIKNTSGEKIKNINIKLKNNSVYCANIWFLERNDGQSAQRLISATTRTEYCGSAIILNIKPRTRDLIINKKDSITNNNITSPAEFKIKTSKGNWLTGTRGSYNYENSNVSLATKYRTDANGVLELKDLLIDTYEIFEVTSPNGYDIQKQNGYDKANNWINCGKVDLNVTNSNVTISIKNDLIISISGRVWEEGIPDKGSYEDYDSKYSEVDKNLEGIKVRLKNKKNGTSVITNSKGDDFVLTDANGMYKFDRLIKKIELENYYVEFDYSSKNAEDTQNTQYIRYIPVAFNKDKTNGSKALASMPTQDREVKGIATTYTGDNQVATYGLEKIGTYNAQTLTLGNINLGIKPLLDPDYDLRENIADLKLTIKGYTYTYVYGGKGKKDNFVGNGENGPAVKWQNSQDMYAYSREMYPSDIIYDKNSSKQELDALVTYRIDVTNTMGENTKELYQQTDKLILTRIENQYDTKRYELVDSNWKDENGSGTATMNDNYKQTVYSNGVDSNNTATAYITFKVKEDALEKILENPDGIIEENPTKVTTEAYHTYYRDDYMWENLGKTETNIEGVKYKENQHQTRNKVKEEKAPYLVFSIDEQRTISGKVFEDKVITNNGEKLGDGIYNEGKEKGLEGVKVELLDIGGERLTTSHLYQGIKNGENEKIQERIVDAIVTTNSEGEYRLEGVVPGRYYLRFTYGNGDYRITNLKGEEVEKGHFSTKLEGKEINVKEYKSTIIKSSIVENALKFVEQITDSMTEEQKQAYEKQLIEDIYTWYKKDEFKEQNYSVAVDDLNVRKALNESQENLNAEALSPQISVTIENTKNNSAQEKEGNDNKINGAKNESGKSVSNISILNNLKENVKNMFDGFYFGIIETPKQNAEIEKIITNVKLTNAQGNILYNGNPENVSTQGAGAVSVSDLDNKKNGGSSYVRAEMVEESLYGSSLELTYEVRITNTSDVNYYNTEYYVYGQRKDNKEVTLTPRTVKDYLDETLKYEEEKSQKDRIEEVNPNVAETINVEGKNVKAQEFNLNGWSTLYTNKITNRNQEHPTTDKVALVATRILSKEDDDMEIVSRAEIKEIEHTPDLKDNDTDKAEQLKIAAKEVHTNGMEKATFTITPPTGKDKNNVTLYAIVGTISLVILATGIVILKKKV